MIFIVLDENDLRSSNYYKNHTKYMIAVNENYGYAKGNNFGLKVAHKLDYEYLLVSNNDILLKSC